MLRGMLCPGGGGGGGGFPLWLELMLVALWGATPGSESCSPIQGATFPSWNPLPCSGGVGGGPAGLSAGAVFIPTATTPAPGTGRKANIWRKAEPALGGVSGGVGWD